MKRVEDVFLHQELTEIEPVGDDDQVLATLKEDKTREWEEIMELNAQGTIVAQEFKHLERQLMKLKMRFESKQFLFWDAVERADERFESAAQRNKLLAIKKDEDGKLVVVEFDAPKNKLDGMGIFIMPPPEGLEGLDK